MTDDSILREALLATDYKTSSHHGDDSGFPVPRTIWGSEVYNYDKDQICSHCIHGTGSFSQRSKGAVS